MKTFEKINQSTNWKDIISKFDEIKDCIIEPDGLTVRTRGTKSGKFSDDYSTYKNEMVATEIHKKVSQFIGVK